MKAALLTGFGSPLEIKQVPEPVAQQGDVLVKVEVAGMCYSDVKIWKGKTSQRPALPHIMGHEIAGTIASTGSNVSNLKTGDRVILYLYDTCDNCPACRTGEDNFCFNMGPMMGFTRPGGFAEYVSVPAKNAIKIPDELDMTEAAVLPDAVLVPYHAAISRARVRFNEWVMLLGMGGLALHGLQILKMMGARVIAVTRTDAKLEIASKLGADFTLNSTRVNIPREIQRITSGEGVDCVMDFAVTTETIDQSIRSLKKGGRIVLVGYSTDPIPINTAMLLSVTGTIMMSRYGTREQLREIIQLVSEGRIKPILSNQAKLDDINSLLMELAEGKVNGRSTVRIAQ